MAKKAKTIEIKSVPTEPQRGAGEGADPNDPVTILYPRGASEELIGSLAGGDEDEAVIKTGGCIVPGDITIRYSAPAAGWTETVCINKNNIVTTLNPEVQNEYVATLPLSDLLNAITDRDFCLIEISGDVDIINKTLSVLIEENVMTVEAKDNPNSPTVQVNITIVTIPGEYEGIRINVAYYDETPAAAPTVNIKLSTINQPESESNSSTPGSDDPGTDDK